MGTEHRESLVREWEIVHHGPYRATLVKAVIHNLCGKEILGFCFCVGCISSGSTKENIENEEWKCKYCDVEVPEYIKFQLKLLIK